MKRFFVMIWELLNQVFGATEEECWQEFLEEAEKADRNGFKDYVSDALSSAFTEEFIRERILQMLFMPHMVQPPDWLTFEHVIHPRFSDATLYFIYRRFSTMRERMGCFSENEHSWRFRALLHERGIFNLMPKEQETNAGY